MSIDTNLQKSDFSPPIIRQINSVKHPSSISLGLGQLGNGFAPNPLVVPLLNQTAKELACSMNESFMYSPNAGTMSLRNVVTREQSRKDGRTYDIENVTVTIGVQNAMYATIGTLDKLGAKRVLIPEIFFGIYKKIPTSFGMEVETYSLNKDFSIDLDDLDGKLRKDDIVILNTPANPTGKVITPSEMRELGNIVNRKLTEGYVISDEIYDSLIYEGEGASASSFIERAIIVNGISKKGPYAGVRVGYIISENKTLIKAITSFNTNIISSPPTLSQKIAEMVVSSPEGIQAYHQEIIANRSIAMKLFDTLNIPYNKPTGSFYIFPDISDYIPDGIDNLEYCKRIAQQEDGVVVIPGITFGPDYLNHIRLSLAIPNLSFKIAMNRLKEILNS